jgi:hypothetical protein
MRQWVCGVGIALAVAGCTNGGTSLPASAATTTTPTPTATTETFTGTVSVGGNDVHPFTVTASTGNLSVTLTAAGPPSTIFMGLGVGTYSGSTCSLLSNGYLTTQAGTVAQLSGTIGAGAYCLMVYDVGNQSAPVTYTALVTHS